MYNFDEVFYWPPFTAMSPVVKHTSRGKPVYDRQGKLVYEEVIREDG
jgi:hypothetical protein